MQIGLESSRGWKILQADTGAAGLATGKEAQPDVILLDVSMPDMNGVTALKELQH